MMRSYVSIIVLSLILLLANLKTTVAAEWPTCSDTTFVNSESQSDSSTGEPTTFVHEINVKNNLTLKEYKENVVILQQLTSSIDDLNSSMDKTYAVLNMTTNAVIEDLRKIEEEKEIEAKAYLFWPILLLISFMTVIISSMNGWRTVISISGILLIITFVLTGIHFSEILKLFLELERSAILSLFK